MSKNFQISVVIPTYNRRRWIGRAIRSVLEQTYTPAEIIVVDDGSSDGSMEYILENFPLVNFVKQLNQGVSSARNKGIRLSSSKWIALLDSDDEWYPKKLENQVKAIQEKPDHKFCHTEEIWVRNGVRVNQMKKHQKYGGHIFEKCLDMCRISPSSVLFQKSILDKTGWFDKELRVCEDYDLWLRVTARYPTLYLNEPLIIKYGGYKDQLSNVKGGIESYRINVLEKLMLIDLTTDQKRLVREMLIQKLSIYAKGAQNRGHHRIYKKSIKRINELSTLL